MRSIRHQPRPTCIPSHYIASHCSKREQHSQSIHQCCTSSPPFRIGRNPIQDYARCFWAKWFPRGWWCRVCGSVDGVAVTSYSGWSVDRERQVERLKMGIFGRQQDQQASRRHHGRNDPPLRRCSAAKASRANASRGSRRVQHDCMCKERLRLREERVSERGI